MADPGVGEGRALIAQWRKEADDRDAIAKDRRQHQLTSNAELHEAAAAICRQKANQLEALLTVSGGDNVQDLEARLESREEAWTESLRIVREIHAAKVQELEREVAELKRPEALYTGPLFADAIRSAIAHIEMDSITRALVLDNASSAVRYAVIDHLKATLT